MAQEKCEECGRTIDPDDVAFTHNDRILCRGCYGVETRGVLKTPPPTSPREPLRRGQGPIITAAVAVCLTIAAATIIITTHTYTVAVVSSAGEETYKGRPFSDWLKLADDNDGVTSTAAEQALRHFHSDSEKAAIVRAFARADTTDRLITLYEASDRASRPGIADRIAKCLDEADYADKENMSWIAIWMDGADGQRILPAMQRLAAKMKAEYPTLYEDGGDPDGILRAIKLLKQDHPG